ncbi:hypothetical protein [Psychrobacter sp. AOP31-A1-22]|uniref:hypothetical protein n=1 Tax=Psychrobacter sp. AOP31-A1-22 TaxID=3457696 RepID=UPI004035727B
MNKLTQSQASIVQAKPNIEAVEQLFTDIFNDGEALAAQNPLSSSEVLGQHIDHLDTKQPKINASQRFALQGMQSILKECAVLEAKLKEFGLIGSRSPKQFLQNINPITNPELTLPILIEKREDVESQLQSVIDNAEHNEEVKDKSDAELIAFTNNLKYLIEKRENYAFIEETKGFFCREVLLAYRKHLEESYEDVLFRGDTEIFTVESVQ